MIKIVRKDGLSCPVVYCDWCNKEIETAAEGNYHWSQDKVSDILFSHKQCCDQLTRARAGKADLTSELDLLPLRLGLNLKVDPDKAMESAKMMAQLG